MPEERGRRHWRDMPLTPLSHPSRPWGEVPSFCFYTSWRLRTSSDEKSPMAVLWAWVETPPTGRFLFQSPRGLPNKSLEMLSAPHSRRQFGRCPHSVDNAGRRHAIPGIHSSGAGTSAAGEGPAASPASGCPSEPGWVGLRIADEKNGLSQSAGGAGTSTSSIRKSPLGASATPAPIVLCSVKGASASQISVAKTLASPLKPIWLPPPSSRPRPLTRIRPSTFTSALRAIANLAGGFDPADNVPVHERRR